MKLKYLIIALILSGIVCAAQGIADQNSTIGTPMLQGSVLEVVAVPGFKYVKVNERGHDIWVGIMDVPVPIKVSKGDVIMHDISTYMRNYKSKLLKREFREVIFASKVEVRKKISKEGKNPKKIQKQVVHQKKPTIDGSVVFQQCISCHGQYGNIAALGVSGKIAKKTKKSLIKLIQAYKEGQRDKYGEGRVMQAQVKYLGEEEIEAVAEYLSKLKEM